MIPDKVTQYLVQNKWLSAPIKTTFLKGGANNKVVLASDFSPKKLVIKFYFEDGKDRREKEYFFCKDAQEKGIENIPKPLALIPDTYAALYSYIEGKPATIKDLDILRCTTFILQMNLSTKKPLLSPATESCFSLRDYIETVERKKDLLESNKTPALQEFLDRLFLPKWEKILSHFTQKYPSTQHTQIPSDERIISPSDFGLHNALVVKNSLFFLDFEYAGIDDIAKLICDFFCQPRIPIPTKYFSLFCERLLPLTSQPQICHQRVIDLMPICQMKWCCILLNVFLTQGKLRRSFSHSPHKEKEQLEKAKNYLKNIQEEYLCPA